MTQDRPQPHDLAAEVALLGGVLVDPSRLTSVSWLGAENFYRAAHQRVWSALLALSDANTPIDTITVRVELERRGWLDEVGGPAYIGSLTDGVPRSSNVTAYADRVRQTADARTALAQVETLREQLEADRTDLDEVLADAEATLVALQGRHQAKTMLGAWDQVQHWQQAIQKADSGPRIGLSLPAIDEALEGVQPGELLGIMARPGIGKTLVLCHITQGLAGAGHVCLSLEMPAAQIIERLARMVYERNKYTLRRELKADDFDAGKYLEACAGLLLDATPGLSVAQILGRVRRAQATQKVTVVTIDHLGLLGGDPKLTTYDRVSKQARELKELAKRCDVAVILLIQANRDAGGDGSRELHLGSARDSGVIEEACDYLIALRRLDRSLTLHGAERERFKDAIFAKVIKHRHGIPMTEEVAYRIDPVSLRLIEDRNLKADENDLRKLAVLPGGRR
jgi:replicative DNA helicase